MVVSTSIRLLSEYPYLREGTVVPEVAFVWEAVADESKLALLDILLDGVQEFCSVLRYQYCCLWKRRIKVFEGKRVWEGAENCF
jgi:hypothetical protein